MEPLGLEMVFVDSGLSSDPADPTAAVTRIAAKLRDFKALDVAAMFAAIDIASNLAAQTAVTRILGMLRESLGDDFGFCWAKLQSLLHSGDLAERLRHGFLGVSIDIDALDYDDYDLSRPIVADPEQNAALFGGATGEILERFFNWLRRLQLVPLPPDEFIWPNLQRLPFELEDVDTYTVEAIIPDRSSPPDRPVDVYKIVLADSTIAGSHIVHIRSDHPALDVSDIVLQIRTLESEEDAERALRFPSSTAAPPASLASPNDAALAFGQGAAA